jgi:hypothetical protein
LTGWIATGGLGDGAGDEAFSGAETTKNKDFIGDNLCGTPHKVTERTEMGLLEAGGSNPVGFHGRWFVMPEPNVTMFLFGISFTLF